MSYVKQHFKKKLGNKSPKAVAEHHTTDKSEEQGDDVPEVPGLSSEEVQETFRLINDIPVITANVSDVIKNISKKIENGDLNTEKGLSFLDLKNLNMLNYISNLSYIVLRKLNGKKIENDPAVKRLAELRVVMEKMRPIESRLKYQIDKLLATTSPENIDRNDPLKFHANPDSLVAQEEEEDAGEEEEQKESKNVYVPPKISAVYYDEENVLERKKKTSEYAQKRALNRRLLDELRQEYDTGPQEIKETLDPYKLKLGEELQERERFEEDFMSRLPVTKRQRHDMRQMSTVTNFDAGFEDILALDSKPNSMQLIKKSKWKKGKFKNKNKKKGIKKKH